MSILITAKQSLLSKKASIIDSGVEFIGVINKRGRLVDSIGHDTIDLPNDKKEMFFMKIALRTSMQLDFDENLGAVEYCLTQRGGSKYISVPIPNGNTIFAVVRKDVNHEGLVVGFGHLMRHSTQFLGVSLLPETGPALN